MHILHMVASLATLLAVYGSSNGSQVVDLDPRTNPDNFPYSTSQDDIQRFFKNEFGGDILHRKKTGSVTLCCHQFSYIIYGRLYTPQDPFVYDGLIQDDALHRLVVLTTSDPDFALAALKSGMKRYMASIGLMKAKPCHLQYRHPTISTANCSSGNTIDCDQKCLFTCDTTNAYATVSTLSTCCDNGEMIPAIPTCRNTSTTDYPVTAPDKQETTKGSRETVTGTKETFTGAAGEATTWVKEEHVTDGNDTSSQASPTGTSATDTTGTRIEHGSRNLKFSGFSALGIFFIIPLAILAWRKLKKRKYVEFINDTEESDPDEYEDVEPDYNGSYKNRSIHPAKPTADQLDREKAYAMSVREKGLIYILNNSKFSAQNHERKGSQLDVENVKHVFGEIGYKPVICENLTAKQIIQSLDNLKKEIKPSHPSVVLMIMSHGDEKGILGVDQRHVTVAEIKNLFSGDRCRALIGKPKIIFVQACRGEKTTKSVLKADSPTESEVSSERDQFIVQSDSNESQISSLPDQCDEFENHTRVATSSLIESDSAEASIAHYYIAQSTTQGYFSLRSRTDGSFFIQALCEELLKRAHEESLDIIMNKVTQRVQSEERHFRSGDRTFQHFQVPQILKQGIDKDILLLPKYPNE